MTALDRVPDPVFSAEMVGPGIALQPSNTVERQTVCAPVAGVIGALFPHAFAIETDLGVGILVHLGIDTVALEGKGFELLVTSGQFVEAGQPLIHWQPKLVHEQGKATVCPVILVQQASQSITLEAEPGALVRPGEPLITWSMGT